jgi:DNA-binding MarR family transcriptional regulator
MLTLMRTLHRGRQGIVSPKRGGVHFVLSPGQLRLLLALRDAGTVLPVRQATRAIWPDQSGPLTPSQRATASRAVTRLVRHGLVERRDAVLATTANGRLTLLMANFDGLLRPA